MIESILTSLFVASRVSIALTSFGLIVGSAVHDWRAMSWQRRQKRNPKAKVLRNRPLVSVVVLDDNSTPSKSISSVAKSAYRKLEIIQVSQNRKSQTLSKISSGRAIKRLVLPRNRNEKKSWPTKLQRSVRGEIILVINSRTQLYPRTIHELLAYFALNQPVEVAALGVNVERSQTLMSLVREYEQALQTSINKTQDVLLNHGLASASPLAWRRQAFLTMIKPQSKPKARQPGKLGYVSGARVLTTPPFSIFREESSAGKQFFKAATHKRHDQKFKWNDLLRGWYRVLLFLEPITLGYSIYVFAAYDVSILLVTNWLITAASLGFFVWGDEQLSVLKRIRLTSLLPLTISLVYVSVFSKIYQWVWVGIGRLKIPVISIPRLKWQKQRQ